MMILLREKAAVHAAPATASRVVAEVEPGAEIERGPLRRGRNGRWAEVTLPDGSRGYLDAATAYLPLAPLRVRSPSGADLRAEPRPEAPTLCRLRPGAGVTPINLVERGGSWLRVRAAHGIEGYLPGDTALEEQGPGLLDLVGGGALMILALG